MRAVRRFIVAVILGGLGGVACRDAADAVDEGQPGPTATEAPIGMPNDPSPTPVGVPRTSPKRTSQPSDLLPQNKLGPWTLRALGQMPSNWLPRDGAEMVQLASGRILMVGGWNSDDPWLDGDGQPARITNEVWKSDDKGMTWSLLLPNDPTPPLTGAHARFVPHHTECLFNLNGHAVAFGADPGEPSLGLHGNVWRESNDGTTWTRISQVAPTVDRSLAICGVLNGALYVMGGQADVSDPTTALNDVWRSTDGGVTWGRLPSAPWSPRALVNHTVEHHGKLVMVGGGRYGYEPYTPDSYNGVYAFDGKNWQTVLPDGHKQFERAFYNGVVSAGDRLWLINGYSTDIGDNLERVLVSDDDGATWTRFGEGAGGYASHADALLAVNDRILRISGDLGDPTIYGISR